MGERATVIAESAVLGVPAVYVNTLKLGYINMLEEYGLLRQTVDTEEALKFSLELLKDARIQEKCASAKEKLLADKIDVTAYIVETLERAGRMGIAHDVS